MRNSVVIRGLFLMLLVASLFIFDVNPGLAAYITAGDSQWLQNASSIYYDSGNVGIGTTNPSTKLQVSGGYIGGSFFGHLSAQQSYSLVYDTFDGYPQGALVANSTGWSQTTGSIWTWTGGAMRSTSPNGDWG